jgi:acyl dehydratase
MTYDVGDLFPTLTTSPIDRMRLAYMAVAMRDPNLVHLEDEYAHKSGLPGIIAHGTFVVSYLCATITQQVGIDALRDFSVDITAPVFEGDVLTCTAEVTNVVRLDPLAELVSVTLVATNATGVVAARGAARFRTEVS